MSTADTGAGVELRQPPSRGRIVAWSILVSTLAALAFWANASELTFDPDYFYRWSSALVDGAFFLVLLGLALLIARGHRELLALEPPRRWRTALAAAAVVVAGSFGFDYAYEWLFGPFDLDQGIPTFWDGSRVAPFAANLLVIAVVVPIVEELLFRGVGYGLFARYGAAVAVVVTSLAFGLVHGHLGLLPSFVAFGAGVAWLRWWTGSIWPGMIAHGAFNAIVTILWIVFD